MATNMLRKLDWFYFWYFVIHVPVTVLIDSCLVIPKEWQSVLQRQIVQFHVSTNNDFLLADPPLWLQVFGFYELVYQLPLFVYGAIQLYRNNRQIYPWLIIYGFNAAFTTSVCLVYVLVESASHGLTNGQMWGLFGLYVPYLVIPGVILIDSTHRVLKFLNYKVKTQ